MQPWYSRLGKLGTRAERSHSSKAFTVTQSLNKWFIVHPVSYLWTLVNVLFFANRYECLIEKLDTKIAELKDNDTDMERWVCTDLCLR